jgi:hypothetical protein
MAEKTRIARSSRATGVHTRGALALYGFGPRALAHVLGVVDADDVRSALASGALVPVNLVELVAARRLGIPWVDRLGEAQDWVRSFRTDVVEDERAVTMMERERGDEVWALGYADVAAATGLPVERIHRLGKSNGYVLRGSDQTITMFDVSKFLARGRGWKYVHDTLVAAGARPMRDPADQKEFGSVDVARRAAAGLRLMEGRIDARDGSPTPKERTRRKTLRATIEGAGDVAEARAMLLETHRKRAKAWLNRWLPKISDPAPPKFVWKLPAVVQYVEDQLREGLESGTLPHGPESEKPLRLILGVRE